MNNRGLLRLVRVNQTFMGLQREINAAIMNTFLGAAFWSDMNGEPLTLSGLAKELDLAPTTVSRHIRYLGRGIRKGQRPGLGLVVTSLDPDDNRNRVIHLTAEGQAVKSKLAAFL